MKLALAATLVLLAGALLEDEVEITGRVTDADDHPVSGARVEARLRGLSPAATAVTDADGRFALVVDPEEYDVRVLARGHLAGLARDVDLREDPSQGVEIGLVARDDALKTLGLSEDDLEDGDHDFVSGWMEKAARTDAAKRDSDDDHVADGVAAWIGAPPRSGTRVAPTIREPLSGDVLPLTPGFTQPPCPLLFDAVPGATSYRLEIVSKHDDVVYSEAFNFEGGGVLLGEGGAVRFTPPANLEPGAYTLVLQALRGEDVGSAAQLTVLFEAFEPERVEVLEQAEWSSLVVGTEVVVPRGTSVKVPAGERCRVYATERITVEDGASIRGVEGATIHLSSQTIEVLGAVDAGAGKAGAPKSGAQEVRADPGERGGDLFALASGEVQVGRLGHLRAGSGGRGGDASASAPEGWDALAVGGDGGGGGDLVVFAASVEVADRERRLESGNGGAGGDAAAHGGAGLLRRPGRVGTALAGIGGASGDVWLSDWDLRRDGVVALDDDTFPLSGGMAGDPGAPTSVAGAGNGDEADGMDHHPPDGREGASGWHRGGAGQPALAVGSDGLGSGRGGGGEATGGRGGSVRKLGVPGTAFALTFAHVARGGTGGRAEARGATGGAGTELREPGQGGSASATGGAGGPALANLVCFPSRGGEGGEAIATGVTGLPGRSGCGTVPPTRGQNGGAGGHATAQGGEGGAGGFSGGLGGNARATAGDGGLGGSGCSPGRGGSAGAANAGGGRGGESLRGRGASGTPTFDTGQRGETGQNCCPK